MCWKWYQRYICKVYDHDDHPAGHFTCLGIKPCQYFDHFEGRCKKTDLWYDRPSPRYDVEPDQYCPVCRRRHAKEKRDNARAADDRKYDEARRHREADREKRRERR